MRFGLFTSMGNQTWSGVLDLWRHIEATGWDIACVTDHFMLNTKEREGAMLESWSTLSALPKKPTSALKPGMTVQLAITGRSAKEALVVPASAVFKNEEGSDYVAVATADNRAQLKTVQTAIRSAEAVQITEGLEEGDPVAYLEAAGARGRGEAR